MNSITSTQTVTSLSDRDIRQRDLVPPQKLAASHALIIGVGAIGRQVAIRLAAVGVPRLELIDPDTVGVENLAPQAYWQDDVGRPKVDATGEVCHELNPMLDLSIHHKRFSRSSPKQLDCFVSRGSMIACFCALDSITTRRLIWETVRHRAAFFADGRMSAEVIRVLASDHPAGDETYGSTLFGSGEAYSGSCTAKSTVYTASIAAGLMLTQFTRWLRGIAIDKDVCLNLLSMEMNVMS